MNLIKKIKTKLILHEFKYIITHYKFILIATYFHLNFKNILFLIKVLHKNNIFLKFIKGHLLNLVFHNTKYKCFNKLFNYSLIIFYSNSILTFYNLYILLIDYNLNNKLVLLGIKFRSNLLKLNYLYKLANISNLIAFYIQIYLYLTKNLLLFFYILHKIQE